MENHPRRAEPVSQHAEAKRKERLLHRHKHLAALVQQLEDALGLFAAIGSERRYTLRMG
jgi:hypothetical protein